MQLQPLLLLPSLLKIIFLLTLWLAILNFVSSNVFSSHVDSDSIALLMSFSDFVFLIIYALRNFILLKKCIFCLAKYIVRLMDMYLAVLLDKFQNFSVSSSRSHVTCIVISISYAIYYHTY